MAGFSDFLFGSPARTEQIQRYTPQQQATLNNLLGAGNQRLGQPEQGYNWMNQFQPIANRAINQFNQQTVPGLAERFSSLGSGAGLSSPAFASQLGQAGAGLQENLAALGSQYAMQGEQLNQNRLGMDRNYLMQLLQGGLQQQFYPLHFQEQPGFLEQSLSGLLQAAPAIAGGFLGGPAGAAGGHAFGALLAKLFSGNGPQALDPNRSYYSPVNY